MSIKKIQIIPIIKYFFLSLLAGSIVIIPLWIVIVNSLKDMRESAQGGLGLPGEGGYHFFENYSFVIMESDFLRALGNTLFILVISVVIMLLLSSMSAWYLARIKTKWSFILFMVLISAIFVSPAIVTSIKLYRTLHIYGSYFSMVLWYTAHFSSFGIFILTGFVKTIPIELEDSARIDGCSEIGLFFRIIFPLLKPALATVSIFYIYFIYADFIGPFYLLQDSERWTLMINMFSFLSQYENFPHWQYVFSYIVITSILPIAVFLYFQKYITSGLTLGALKD
jgi:raffinose/stachyose/melibiose transport system permease protein